jgi:hypothetical protein
MSATPELVRGYPRNYPPDTIDLVVVPSELPGRSNEWIGTYVNWIPTRPVVWISLGPDEEKIYVVGWPDRPLPDATTLLQTIHYLGRCGLVTAWVIGWLRPLSITTLLRSDSDCMTILCGAGQTEEADTVWFAGDLRLRADEEGLEIPPLRLAVAEGLRKRTEDIAREIAVHSGLVTAWMIPLPVSDPPIGASYRFNEPNPPSLRSVIQCIRDAISGQDVGDVTTEGGA